MTKSFKKDLRAGNPHQAKLIESQLYHVTVDPAVTNELAGEWRNSREQVATALPSKQSDSMLGKRGNQTGAPPQLHDKVPSTSMRGILLLAVLSVKSSYSREEETPLESADDIPDTLQ